jgi:hypothetical protein
MTRIRIIGLALVAVVALSAFASASAFAAPEFKGEGAVAGTTFTSTSGAGKMEGTETIKCSASTSSGEITSATTVGKVVVTFTGCEDKGKKCKSSSGAAAGEIKTVSLKGELGEVASAEAASGVGELLTPESGSKYVSIESCTLFAVEVTGSVIGEVTPINTLSTEGKLIYTEASKKQTIKKFVGGSTHELSAFGSSGLETSNTVTFSKAIEVT